MKSASFFPSKSGDVKEIIVRGLHPFSEFNMCESETRYLAGAVCTRQWEQQRTCCLSVCGAHGPEDTGTFLCFLSSCRNIFLTRKETIHVFFRLYLIANDSILDDYFIVKMVNFLCSGLSRCSSYTNNIVHWKTLKRCHSGPGEGTPPD